MHRRTGGERRHTKRFALDCPVTVGVRSEGNGHGLEQGQLLDVGARGARFQFARFLAQGTRVVLYAHFSHPNGAETTVRFEGAVTRAEKGPPHEIAVRFTRSGKFLKRGLAQLFQNRIGRQRIFGRTDKES